MKKLLIILVILATQVWANQNDDYDVFTAIENNNVNYITTLIKNNSSELNYYYSGVYSTLHYAVMQDKLDIVKLLVEYGFSPEYKEFGIDLSPIKLAIENNNYNMIEYLISRGLDINYIDDRGKTYLDFPIENNNYDIINYLVSKGISSDTLSKALYNALWKNSELKVIKYLISKGANLRNNTILENKNPIFLAVKNKNQEVLKFLIDNEFSINILDEKKLSPLDCAIENSSYEIIKFLLDNETEMNPLNDSFISFASAYNKNDKKMLEIFIDYFNEKLNDKEIPIEQGIFLAAISNNKSYLKSAVNKKGLMNKRDYFGMTPIMWATYSNNLEEIQLFIDNGASIFEKDYNDNNLLMWSCRNNNSIEIIDYLIKKGADISNKNKNGTTAMDYTIFNNSFSTFLYLYTKHNNWDNQSIVENASFSNSLEILKYMVEKQDVVFNKEKALLVALSYDSNDAAKYLVEKNSDIDCKDEDGFTPLLITVNNKNIELAKLLLVNGANVNARDKENNSLLQIVLSNYKSIDDSNSTEIWYDKNMVELLLEYGININTENNDGDTPMITAVNHNNLELIRKFVENGVDLKQKNNEGWTPLMLSIGRGLDEISDYLLNLTFPIEEKTDDGESALMIASTNGNISALNKLIQLGAEIDTEDNEGATPLMWAAHHSVIDSMEVLIKSNANIEAQDYYGNTALIYAARNNSLDAIDYLLARGAKTKVKNSEGKGLLELAGDINTRKHLISKGVKW